MSGETTAGRVPPHNREAERALLGSLLLDPELIAEIAESLKPEDFYDKRCGAVFGALVDLSERSVPIDFVTVSEALQAGNHLDEIGGTKGIVELAAGVTSSAHAMHYARLVGENSLLRNLISEATEIVTKAFDTRPNEDAVQKLLDDSEHRIFSIAGERDTGGAESIADTINEVWMRIDARTGREGLTGIPTEYYELDEKLCGLNAGDLIVVAARPSMGKTAFALNLIDNAARSQPEWLGHNPKVLMYSLEMGRMSMIERMLCCRARVEAHRLRAGRLSDEERVALTEAADELRRYGVFIDDTPGLSMPALRSRARRLKATSGLDMIVVDYLQLLSFPRSESRQQEISSISRGLKAIARELNIPVIALAQLSRAVESRDPPRPQLADLRESGSIEQDADVVMLLYRPEYYPKFQTEENRGLAEVIVAKHRNGPTGIVRLQFFPSTMRFENRAPNMSEPIAL